MKLATLAVGGGRPAVLIDDQLLDLGHPKRPDAARTPVPASVQAVVAGGEAARAAVTRAGAAVGALSREGRGALVADGVMTPFAQARLLPPLPSPGLIFSAGANYKAHLEEMKVAFPPRPAGFIKNNNSLIGHGDPIVLPRAHPDMVDYEGEMTIVFGRTCHAVSEADAMGYVAGYTIANDVSARDWVRDFIGATTPAAAREGWDTNILGKQFPSFCPLGPVVVTADEIADPHDMAIRTTINGKVLQDSNTSDLLFNVPQLIAWFSRWFVFRAGDMMTTGSPPGVGFARKPQRFLKAGDRVAVSVGGVGTLENPV
ncbi:MAG: fumarylacetoacetate hydrolase family protein, partial [Alphaproteobacteria bacterium]|nr:fumarylacetoacetate hydrolase family protein [Alphaproteobacteria bacterium]